MAAVTGDGAVFGRTLTFASGDGVVPIPYHATQRTRLTIKANNAAIYFGSESFLSGSLPASGFLMVQDKEYEFVYGPPAFASSSSGDFPAVKTTSGSNVSVSFVVTFERAN